MDTHENRAPSLFASDVRGLARLGFDATVAVTDLVEAMHHTIGSLALPFGRGPSGRTSGLTGVVYGTVRGTARLVGRGIDAAFGALVPAAPARTSTVQREAALAVLNGVWGDHLVATGNPLAIPMCFRIAGRPLDLTADPIAVGAPSRKVLVLAHGLCMNDRQWTRDGHDHGQALARDLGYTPVYLHYNSGRHVSENGRDFSQLLERLVARWPVPVDELAIIGHSMGGLLARSACHHAEQAGLRWRAALKKIVFVGTPHHGAPLERGGHRVDTLFGISPYLAPFGRLGRARSAGITDLRFGNLLDADWQGRDRHSQKDDDRRPLPLPRGVRCFVLAGCEAKHPGGIRAAVIGDGLVPVASALGTHREARRALKVPKRRTRVVTGATHWDLLSRADVYAQIREWMATGTGR